MMEVWMQHAGTALICLLIITGIVLAVRKLIREHKNGRSLCGDNCSGCPHSGTCHKDTTL